MDVHVSLFDRVFAVTIAFLLPGLAPIAAAAPGSQTVANWFGAASQSPTIGGLLFVVLAALASGMALTALRWMLFEELSIFGCRLVQPGTPVNEAARKDHLAVYDDLRYQHYYFYLASANMAVAVPVALIVWLLTAVHRPSVTTLALVMGLGAIAMYVLAAAGCNAIRRYDDRRHRLLGPAAAA